MRRSREAALFALLLGLAAAAGAAIPEAQRIADAAARANQKAGRSEPIILDVSLRIGDSEPLATGVLASHPTGLARLELRSHQGFVERRPHPSDGRTTLATITDDGRRVVEDATVVLNEEVFADVGLSAREVEQLARLLARITRMS